MVGVCVSVHAWLCVCECHSLLIDLFSVCLYLLLLCVPQLTTDLSLNTQDQCCCTSFIINISTHYYNRYDYDS